MSKNSLDAPYKMSAWRMKTQIFWNTWYHMKWYEAMCNFLKFYQILFIPHRRPQIRVCPNLKVFMADSLTPCSTTIFYLQKYRIMNLSSDNQFCISIIICRIALHFKLWDGVRCGAYVLVLIRKKAPQNRYR